MHSRGHSFQSGANLRSSKQLSFGALPGVSMEDSSRASARTGSGQTSIAQLVSSDAPVRRGIAHHSLGACFRRCAKEWVLLLVLLGMLAFTEFVGVAQQVVQPTTASARESSDLPQGAVRNVNTCSASQCSGRPEQLRLLLCSTGAPGRKQYITQNVLDAVQFPHEPDTVPSWAVPVMSLLGPPVVICVHGALAEVTLPVRHSAVLASLFSTAVTALATNVFKLTVGRPRPDFFFRCWPDGQPVFRDETPSGLRWPACAPNSIDVDDGYKSFPSGHTSWTFAAFLFLSLYLYHFIRPGGAADSVDLLLVMLPTMVAAWVGMTRVIDNRHNPSDVLAGGLLGAAIAAAVFYSFYPHGRPAKGVEVYMPPRLSEAEMLPV